MMKASGDLLEYLRGSKRFLSAPTFQDPWIYPIDLEFTLREEDHYYLPKDTAGIPIKRYVSVGEQYNPTRIAAFGLAHWNRLRMDQASASSQPFLLAARWFRDNAADGAWLYQFDWNDLRAPWISCMAQGEGISVLARAALLTGENAFLVAAEKALGPLRLDSHEGGVLSNLPDGSAFLEEFPSTSPVHVLNGYLYTLIGLADLDRIAPDGEAATMLGVARQTLERNLKHWNLAGWSAYDLHNLDGGPRNFCTAAYHRLQVTQLQYLGRILDSEAIVQQAGEWERTAASIPKRLRAAVGKIGYRLRYRAQR